MIVAESTLILRLDARFVKVGAPIEYSAELSVWAVHEPPIHGCPRHFGVIPAPIGNFGVVLIPWNRGGQTRIVNTLYCVIIGISSQTNYYT